MKVLLINAIAEKGSTGRICKEIIEYLIENGHEARLLYALGNSADRNVIKVTNNTFIKLNAFYSRISGLNGYACFRSTNKIIKFIDEYQPNIIHLHNAHSNFVNLGRLLRYIEYKKIPLIITLHDCWTFTGKCTNFSAIGCEKWKNKCEKCPKNNVDFPSCVLDRTAKMWSDKLRSFSTIENLGIIGISTWIMNQAKASPFFKNARFQTIYNWIDTALFKPTMNSSFIEKYDIDVNKKIIFCVSDSWNIGADRYDDLIKLGKAIGDEFCILVGGHFEKNIVLPQNIKLIGYLNQSDLVECYSNSDVYVHLSREDSFGKVIVEAMACGTPVVTYDSTAYPELVRDFNGFTVETGNIEKMVEAIHNVLNLAYDKQQLHNYVETKFSKDILLGDTLNFYRKMSTED